MANSYENMTELLFKTNAVRVSPKDNPFWYTSGTIGPYYVNTHFLYGSEAKANELLEIIDKVKSDKLDCPNKLYKLTTQNYDDDKIYSEVIDTMVKYIKNNIDLDKVDLISGGERRDWFFSYTVASILGKPHVTIYKDSEAVICEYAKMQKVNDLKGRTVLHIADLITEASSYSRAWIPAINNVNGKLLWSVVVVDRLQGGSEVLAKEGVESHSLTQIGPELFESAADKGFITSDQFEMIKGYIKNPKEAMRNFLLENPSFLKDALNSDEKTAERAKLCIEKNMYNL